MAAPGSQVYRWWPRREWTPRLYRIYALMAGALGIAFLGLAIVSLVLAVVPRWESLCWALIGSTWLVATYVAWRRSVGDEQQASA